MFFMLFFFFLLFTNLKFCLVFFKAVLGVMNSLSFCLIFFFFLFFIFRGQFSQILFFIHSFFFFPLLVFWVYHFTFFQPTRFVLINALIVLCEPPLCMVKDFSLVFKIHSLSLTFDNLVITYLSVDFCVVFAALWAYESGVWFLSQI